MGLKLNRKGVAEAFGCSLPTVDVWVKEGLPAVTAGSKGVEWQFDSVAVHQWLVKKAKSARRTRGNRFGEGEDGLAEGEIVIEEAKRRKEVAAMLTAELELAEAMGAVAPLDAILKTLSDEISNAKARILAIPSKLRPTALMHAATPEKAKLIVEAAEKLVLGALTEIKSGGAPSP